MKKNNQNIIKEVHILSKLVPAFMAMFIRIIHQSGIQEATGFTQEQIKILMMVNFNGPVRLSFLTKHVGVTQGTMTVMVQRLIKKKMLYKTIDPTDKRGILIHMSEFGKSFGQKVDAHFIKLFNEICQGLTPNERQEFVRSYQVQLKVYQNYILNKSIQERIKKPEQGLVSAFPIPGVFPK